MEAARRTQMCVCVCVCVYLCVYRMAGQPKVKVSRQATKWPNRNKYPWVRVTKYSATILVRLPLPFRLLPPL